MSQGERAKEDLYFDFDLIYSRGEELTSPNDGFVRSQGASGDVGRDVTQLALPFGLVFRGLYSTKFARWYLTSWRPMLSVLYHAERQRLINLSCCIAKTLFSASDVSCTENTLSSRSRDGMTVSCDRSLFFLMWQANCRHDKSRRIAYSSWYEVINALRKDFIALPLHTVRVL